MNLLKHKKEKTLLSNKKSQFVSEKLMAKIFFFLLLIYTVAYGFYNFDELTTVPLSLSALIILIPIFFTDVIKICIESLAKRNLYQAKEDISKVTVVIATYNGQDTIEKTVKNLQQRFSNNRIIVVSNGSTDNTIQLVQNLNVKLINIGEPIGKVEAIHRSLDFVETEQVLIMDDDTLLGNAIIPTNAIDEGYEAAAFKVLPMNQNWLSKVQLHEYRKSMDISRGFHNVTATVQSISGAIGLFHVKELRRQTQLHTGEFSGEDLQRTLLIHVSTNSKGVVITNSTVETEVPSTLTDIFNQRVYGWNPGQLANFGLYSQLIFGKNVPLKLRIEAFYNNYIVTALDPLRVISLPILLFSPTYMIIFYITYVSLETIPYLSMGRKEPYWVILISPFYGLFNFITRVLANAVFLYRRLSYKIANAIHYDDYKHAGLKARTLSVSLSSSLLGSLLFGYSYVSYLPENTNITFTQINTEAEIISPLASITYADKDLGAPIPTVALVKKDFIYTVKPGDSVWRISSIAVNEYLKEKNITLNANNKKQFLKNVIETQKEKRIQLNSTFVIDWKLLDKEYNSAIYN